MPLLVHVYIYCVQWLFKCFVLQWSFVFYMINNVLTSYHIVWT